MKKMFLVAGILVVTPIVNAGVFSSSAFGDHLGAPVSKVISDLVSEDFTSTFPHDRYEIVVVYQHARLGNDNVCYAMAGVSKKQKEGSRSSVVPALRFNSTQIDRNTGSWTTAKVRECLSQAVRDAVENMMSVPARELKQRSEP